MCSLLRRGYYVNTNCAINLLQNIFICGLEIHIHNESMQQSYAEKYVFTGAQINMIFPYKNYINKRCLKQLLFSPGTQNLSLLRGKADLLNIKLSLTWHATLVVDSQTNHPFFPPSNDSSLRRSYSSR